MNHDRVIVHIDIDCFYSQVEMIRNPDLKNKPVGIQQKYLLVTCNYEARKKGVTKLMSLVEAKKKCPDIVVVNGEDLTHYRHMSYQISEYLHRYTPCVERLGFDENFVDVTEMVQCQLRDGNFDKLFKGHVYKEIESAQDDILNPPCGCGCELRMQIGSQIAANMREGLEHDLSITSCAGIAHNKLLAKLVGSIHKPNQQTTILPHLACQLMSSLPGVRAVPGIGSRTTKRLNGMGIHSISDLSRTQLSDLEREFGSAMASLLLKMAIGVDETPVVKYGLPQSLSDEDSFKCCNEISDVRSRIEQLICSLLERLKEDGRIPQTLRLTIRRTNYHRESRQSSINQTIFTKFFKTGDVKATQKQLLPALMNLFSKMVPPSESFHLTLLNVCFTKLFKQAQNNLNFFFTPYDEDKKQNLGRDTMPEEIFLGNESLEKISNVSHQEKFNSQTTALPSKSSPQQMSSLKVTESQEVLPSSDKNDVRVRKFNMLTSLKQLLPFHLNAETILELPEIIQKEVLSSHGIHSELAQSGDMVFVLSNIGVSTRSKVSNTRKPLFSPKKKGQKRVSTSPEENINKHVHFDKGTQDFSENSNDLRLKYFENMEKSDFCLKKDTIVVGEDEDKINILNSKGVSLNTTQCSPCDTHMFEPKNSLHEKLSSENVSDLSKTCEQAPETMLKTYSTTGVASTTNTSVFDRISLDIIRSHSDPGPSSTVQITEQGLELSHHQDINTLSETKLSPEVSRLTNSNTKKNSCPQGMDPEVFSALPASIQGEIKAHVAMGSEHVFLSRPALFSSPFGDGKKKEQKTLLSFFKKT